MTRMRTISAAYAEVKAVDPKSALTMNGLRTLVLTGSIPTIRLGVKYLINLDVLEAYLGMGRAEGEDHSVEKAKV